MRTSELRKYIGRYIKFKSNRTRMFRDGSSAGIIKEVCRKEALINGDWHDIKTFEIIEFLDGWSK